VIDVWFLTGVDRWAWGPQGFILIRALEVRWNDYVLTYICTSEWTLKSLESQGCLRPELNNRRYLINWRNQKITTDFIEFTHSNIQRHWCTYTAWWWSKPTYMFIWYNQ
jgi:hypothetical protein